GSRRYQSATTTCDGWEGLASKGVNYRANVAIADRDRPASRPLPCRSNRSVRRPASQVCGRAVRLNASKDRVAAPSIDEPLQWRGASASFPRHGFSIPEALKARLTKGPNPAGYPCRDTLVIPSRRVPGGLPPVRLGPQQASAAIDRCSFAPDNSSGNRPEFVRAADKSLAIPSRTTAPTHRGTRDNWRDNQWQ